MKRIQWSSIQQKQVNGSVNKQGGPNGHCDRGVPQSSSDLARSLRVLLIPERGIPPGTKIVIVRVERFPIHIERNDGRGGGGQEEILTFPE